MSGYDIPETDLPGEDEATLAEEASRILTARMAAAEPPQLRLPGKYGEEKVRLPQTAVKMLMRILDGMASGNAMMLVPVDSELTTQQAAHMLNVSRPTLIQLLSDGKIAFRKVGTHRRVRCADVIEYKRLTDRERIESVARDGMHRTELSREHIH
jgi:excisionase family DNA binding protein